MTILCSDKTGTLTLNKLSLREPILLTSGITAEVRRSETTQRRAAA